MGTKYGAKKTWSQLCGRTFDSRLECRRAEELWMLQMAGEIWNLEFQVKFKLCEKPRITVSIDFHYFDGDGFDVHEDAKGMQTRDCRTRYAWLKQLHNVDVKLWTGK